MAVSVSIPVTQDYREAILAAGEADFITNMILVGQYIYASAGEGIATGKIIRINKDNFSERTVLTYPGTFPTDRKHIHPIELCYVPSTGLIYVLFLNVLVPENESGDYQLTIGRVGTSPFAILSDFVDITGVYQPGNGSITTDGNYLYAVMWYSANNNADPSPLLKFDLVNAALTASVITGHSRAHCVRYANGKLYAAGWNQPSDAWLARIDFSTPSAVVEQSATFQAAEGEFYLSEFAMSSAHLWVSDRSLRGVVKKFSKSDLAVVTDIATGQLARSTQSANDGTHIWTLFENGRSVRIKTTTNEQGIYTLNTGQGFQSELVGEIIGSGDDTYIYVGWNQASTKIARYHIPPTVVDTLRPSDPTFISPANGSTVSGIITLEGFGTDQTYDANGHVISIPLYKIDFYTQIGGANVVVASAFRDAENRYRTSFDTNSVFNGTVFFLCRAVDEAGNVSAFRNISVTVANTPVIVQSWASQIHSIGGANIYVHGTAVDSSGKIIVVGRFLAFITGQSVDFSGISKTSTPSGGFDAFIAKYSASGTIEWVTTFGGTGDDAVYSVACDSANNIVVTGAFSGTVNFGNGQSETTPGGANDREVFVAKYNSSGVCQWVNQYGGGFENSAQAGKKVVCRGTDIFVLIDFYLGVNFGGGALPFFGSVDIGVAKLDLNGTHLWSKSFGSTSYDVAIGLAVDSSGDVCISGENTGPIDFGGGALRVSNATDIWVAKLSGGNGSHLWSFCKGSLVSQGLTTMGGAAFDGSGNVIITGTFTKTVNFGGTDKTASFGPGMFRAKYNSAGVHIWSEAHVSPTAGGDGGPAGARGFGISTGSSDNIAMVGAQNGAIDFGSGQLTYPPSNGGNGYLVSYQPSKTYRVQKIFPASFLSNARAVTMQNNDIIIAGEFGGRLTLENGIILIGPSTGAVDILDVFVVKYAPP